MSDGLIGAALGLTTLAVGLGVAKMILCPHCRRKIEQKHYRQHVESHMKSRLHKRVRA